MTKSRERAFYLSFAAMVLSVLTIISLGSFSLLWLQYEISSIAEETVILEKHHQEIIRKLDFLDEKITLFHQPVTLQSKVSHSLVPLNESQIVWVDRNINEVGNTYVDAQRSSKEYFKNSF
mgnify:CR=1 FL=1|tara:strand:- start:248 stop:610 length:363 start_codon:yes stop_codon:yes gene_type:complete